MNADHKHSEALATEIAECITNSGIPAVVSYSLDAGTHLVEVDHLGDRYDLAMPAPGALFALWRNGAWLGGMNVRGGATPQEVTAALIRRILAVLTNR